MSARTISFALILAALPATLLAQTDGASATTQATATPAPAKVVHPKVGNEIELGRQFTMWLYFGQFDSLYTRLDAESRTELGSPEKMAEEFDSFVAQVGEETELIEEKVVMRNGNPQYWRTANFSQASEPIMLRWVIVNGEIRGIGANPASQAPPIDPEQ